MRALSILSVVGLIALAVGALLIVGPPAHPALSSLALMTFAVAAFSGPVR